MPPQHLVPYTQNMMRVVGAAVLMLREESVDAAKCAKITDMFAGGAAVAPTSSETAMIQQQVEGEEMLLTDRESVKPVSR